jgi:hypothetical protein
MIAQGYLFSPALPMRDALAFDAAGEALFEPRRNPRSGTAA